MDILIWILAFAITAGQLIKIPFGSGNIILLDIVVIIFCIWGLLKIKLSLFKPPAQMKAAFIFIAIAIISLTVTPLHLQIGEYVISFSYSIRFSIYILFAWLIFSNAFGDFGSKIYQVFLLSGISFAVLGLMQFIFFPNLNFLSFLGWDPHYFRTVSTFLDPNFAGAFFVLTLLLILFLQDKKKITTIFFYSTFILVFISLLTTFSRSSYLMFLISFLTFSYLKKSIKIAFFSIILFLLLLASFQIYSKLITQPRNIDRTQSASFRLTTWQQGFELFQKTPIFGIGYNAYRYGISQYKLGDDQFLKSHGSSGNDSSLLFILSTTGILGLIAYLYFLFTLIKSKNIVLVAGITGLLIHSLFANSLFYPPILIWILLFSVVPKK